jgi:hypothetical protein
LAWRLAVSVIVAGGRRSCRRTFRIDDATMMGTSIVVTVKTPYRVALAGALLLLPTIACAQAPRAVGDERPAASPRGGMTSQEFITRRERRMLAADTDGDGRVSKTEFLAAAAQGKGRGDPARRFAKLDRNGDGMIDRPEIAAMLAHRFARLDTDGDGSLSATKRPAARMAVKRAAPEA